MEIKRQITPDAFVGHSISCQMGKRSKIPVETLVALSGQMVCGIRRNFI
jgi:hypothetical protein